MTTWTHNLHLCVSSSSPHLAALPIGLFINFKSFWEQRLFLTLPCVAPAALSPDLYTAVSWCECIVNKTAHSTNATATKPPAALPSEKYLHVSDGWRKKHYLHIPEVTTQLWWGEEEFVDKPALALILTGVSLLWPTYFRKWMLK